MKVALCRGSLVHIWRDVMEFMNDHSAALRCMVIHQHTPYRDRMACPEDAA